MEDNGPSGSFLRWPELSDQSSMEPDMRKETDNITISDQSTAAITSAHLQK